MAHKTELACDRCGKFLWSRGGMDWYAKEVSARAVEMLDSILEEDKTDQ